MGAAIDLNGDTDGTSGAVNYTEQSAPTAIAPDALLRDFDSFIFDGATFQISLTANATSADELLLLHEGMDPGQIGIVGNDIYYGGTLIGTFAGGSGGSDLVITTNGAADALSVDAVIRTIAFHNTSDDPLPAPRTVTVTATDTASQTASSDAEITLITDNIATIPVVADGTDQSALINAYLANSHSATLQLPPGEYCISSPIIIPDGKQLVGAGQDSTSIKFLADFGGGLLPIGNSAILIGSNAGLSDLTVDGDKVNNGAGTSQRICAVTGTGTDFLVENVTVKDATGYAFWANGLSPATPASGVFRDCYAENSNVLFETTYADGVLFERCVGADGDGDVNVLSAFHPIAGSSNITFRDCSYSGYSVIVSVHANVGPQDNIVFERVTGTTTTSVAFDAQGDHNQIFLIDSSFTSLGNIGLNLRNVDLTATNTYVASSRLAVALFSGSASFTDSTAIVENMGSFEAAAFAIVGPVSWNGGHLTAIGGAGTAYGAGAFVVSAATSIVTGDLAVTREDSQRRIIPLANDRGANGAPLDIVAIDGMAITPAGSVTLSSGAIVTLGTDGALAYDPAGAFDYLNDGPGTPGESAQEWFRYTLSDGHIGAVRVTITGVGGPGIQVSGTNAADNLFGRTGNDYLSGGGGDDQLFGMDGNDTLVGGDGNDRLYGGLGDDVLFGGVGEDYIVGGKGNDKLYGQDGDDTLAGDEGDDRLDGGAGADILFGGLGRDSLIGGAGNDQLYGQEDNDTLAGEEGDDRLDGGDGDDRLDGGAGADVLYGGTGRDFLAGGIGNDQLYGQDGDDTLVGEDGDDSLDGGEGADTLFGGNGRDFLVGGNGNDQLFGQDGNDTLIGDGGDDYLEGGAGSDTLFGGAGRDYLLGGADNDKLYGQDGDDTLIGEDGDDYLEGGAGSDTLFGGNGRDFLAGGVGNDKLYGQDGDDTIVGEDGDDYIVGDAGNDTIFGGLGRDYVLGGADNDYIDGQDGDDTILGEGGNDTLYGGAGADSLFGGAGRDFLAGGEGNDKLYGQDDDDTIAGDGGDDYIEGGLGNDTIFGGTGRDYLLGGLGADQIYGGDDADTLIGEGGDDYLSGGAGSDTLFGGLGRDFLVGDAGDDKLYGQDGDDTIVGGDGNDLIEGGTGNDTLFGSAGRDVFRFAGSDLGTDFIADFESGIDKIDLRAFGIGSAQASWAVVGSNTLISIDTDRSGSADLFIAISGTTLQPTDLLF